MASIQKKKVKGHTYYFAIETKRIDGKVHTVWSKHLGKAEDLLRKLEAAEPPAPAMAKVFDFGAAAALYSIARRWGLVEIINQHVSKRQQGLSVGEYMLIAAINRAVAPKSKRQIGEWFASTSLRRWITVQPEKLTSQRFWDHMSYLGADEIRAIEDDLLPRLLTEFGIDVRCLLYDATNFFTYIDSATPAQLPQRGHSKAKRDDLRQVSLALLVSADFHVPLLHHVYPGNVPDSKEFAGFTDSLVQRYQRLAQHCQDITLVFDKGNNAGANQQKLDESRLHFVGSLVPAQYPDLLQVPLSEFAELVDPRCPGVSAYRVQLEVLGQERTVVVTYNDSLYLGQIQGLTLHLKKAAAALKELQRRLLSGTGKPASVKSVQQQVDAITRAQYLAGIISTTITEEQGRPRLSFTIDHDAIHRLTETSFGKTLLFTDRSDWATADIVAAYRGQIAIEDAFKEMKDPQYLSWSPLYHWTDQKIRVHAFYCVLALTLSTLLRREAHRLGVDMSLQALFDELTEIREVAVIYPHVDGVRYRDHMTLTPRNPVQEKLFQALDLQRYALS